MLRILVSAFFVFGGAVAAADPVLPFVGTWTVPGGTLEIKPNHEISISGPEVSFTGDLQWINANRFLLVNYLSTSQEFNCQLVIRKGEKNSYSIQFTSGNVKYCQQPFAGEMKKVDSKKLTFLKK